MLYKYVWIFLIIEWVLCGACNELQVREFLQYIGANESVRKNELYALCLSYKDALVVQKFHQYKTLIPLFKAYPGLLNALSYVELGQFPTQLKELFTLSKQLDTTIIVKCDDQTATFDSYGYKKFGGNKIRKLEFLLADALAHDAKTILTFGCAGSNHVVATAACAQQLGIPCEAMLKSQPNSQVVRRNLLLMRHYKAGITYAETDLQRMTKAIDRFIAITHQTGSSPYVIPTGGSCALGAVGYVNAVFELKQQIEQGIMLEPHVIYVAAGSMGTAAGLLLGIKAAGLKTKLICVAVEPASNNEIYFKEGIKKLFKETNQLLHAADSLFPLFHIADEEIYVNYNFCGESYGLFTHEAMSARKILQEKEGIVLDGTYSSRPFAALLDDARHGFLKNKIVLFWNTFCADTFDAQMSALDYHDLPQELHQYFEQSVQELDKEYENV